MYPMFISALFTIAKTWKQNVHQEVNGERRHGTICTMEYFSDIKKNEIMPFVATWMNLEIIVLNEIHQKQKDKYHMISLVCRI